MGCGKLQEWVSSKRVQERCEKGGEGSYEGAWEGCWRGVGDCREGGTGGVGGGGCEGLEEG